VNFRRGYKGGRKSSDVNARPPTDAYRSGYDLIDWSNDGGRRLPMQSRDDTREHWYKPSEQRELEEIQRERAVKARENTAKHGEING
jgi:hypothetical protein